MKRPRIVKHRVGQGMTKVGWGILVCSAVLSGIVASMAITGKAPAIPWDTRGGPGAKANARLR